MRASRTGQLGLADDMKASPELRALKPAQVEQRIPVYCALPYDGLVRTAIRAWKYDGAIDLTDWFAKSVVQAMAASERRQVTESASRTIEYASQTEASENDTIKARKPMYSTPLWSGIDAIVPVPTSRDRYVKRGYDHVRLFAERISQVAHQFAGADKPVAQWLYRKADGTSFTQSQTAKTARERLSTLQGKFYVSDSARVQGRRILLVDDVVTTGATLLTCSSALLEAGAAQVVCAAIAQVE